MLLYMSEQFSLDPIKISQSIAISQQYYLIRPYHPTHTKQANQYLISIINNLTALPSLVSLLQNTTKPEVKLFCAKALATQIERHGWAINTTTMEEIMLIIGPKIVLFL